MHKQIYVLHDKLIRPKRGKAMETIVAGIDSETCHGEPISIQIWSEEEPKLNKCLFMSGDSATAELFRYLSRVVKSGYYRFYCHNLKFDAISFFWTRYHDLAHIEGFEFTVSGWNIKGFYGTPTFFRATKGSAIIDFVDSYLWFATSLAQAARMHFPDIPKLPMPKGLGVKKFTKKDKYFVDYAMQDSIIAAKLGRMIDDMHIALEIRPQISLAGMSSTVFLSHFLKHEIVPVPTKYVRGAVCAYHGGKNNVITNAAPAWHMNINSYDVSSAYPFSMAQLPGYSDMSNYNNFKGNARTKSVPSDGVYLISGKVSDCEWPSLFHHNFKPVKGESVDRLWVNGYELNEALRTGEVKLSSIKGIYYDAPDSEDRPLKRFVEHFYNAKENSSDPVERFRNKIVLNSLYGKFIQTKEILVEDKDGNSIREKVAAGLFQPLIAGSITGHTRSMMHYIEHELEAIHTATDGVYSYKKLPKNLKLPKKGLGSLQYEGSGTLALVRNKLYVLYADDGKIPSIHFSGKMIKKYARHAFMGTLADLEAFLAFGKRKYSINKPNTLKDSINRALTPNEFVVKDYMLRAGNMKVYRRKK